ncbi:MAG: DUF2254 domain-containing protein [bacterium]
MRIRLTNAWFWLRSSYWFVPLMMTLGAAAAALALVSLDRSVAGDAELAQWVYSGSAAGARGLLAAVASSMITVAGVVFSITMVALALTSSQFGPRLLINFMRDSGNQVVLGAFVATFMYCLLVLRVVRGGTPEFVPHFAVTAAIALAATAVFLLIYYIHHVSVSIQAENVIAAVRDDLSSAIESLLAPAGRTSGTADAPPRRADWSPAREAESVAVPVARSGYIQAIDDAELLRLGQCHDLLIRLGNRPGDFVVAGSPVARAWSAQPPSGDMVDALARSFVIGAQRTPTQDPEFAVNQLVEVAVRALSPGINDPFTAMACVDWLADGLCRLAEGDMPAPERYDDKGAVRLIVDAVTFPGIADAAFNQIRQYARGSAAVTIRLLEALRVIATRAHVQVDRDALQRHTMMIQRGSETGLPEELDRAAVRERVAAVLDALRAAQR